MLKHKFAALIITGLFLGTGAAQASSVFPSAAEEGSGYSVNAPLPEPTNAVNPIGFPTAALEGGEFNEQVNRAAATSQSGNYARANSVFPSTAIE